MSAYCTVNQAHAFEALALTRAGIHGREFLDRLISETAVTTAVENSRWMAMLYTFDDGSLLRVQGTDYRALA